MESVLLQLEEGGGLEREERTKKRDRRDGERRGHFEGGYVDRIYLTKASSPSKKMNWRVSSGFCKWRFMGGAK